MYYIYILKSEEDNKTYVGYTNNLEQRLKQHNAGQVAATKHRRPLKLMLYEEFEIMTEAKKREKYWKSGAGRRKLKLYFKEGFPPIQNAE